MAAHNMTPARRAALRKAQMASARKRKGKPNPRLKAAHAKARKRGRRIGQAAVVVAAGGTAYAAYKHRGAIKAKSHAAKGKAKAKVGAIKAKSHAAKGKAKAKVVKKAENNHKVRTEVTRQLMAEARSKKRPANKGLKMGKQYRMGRPDVRKKRKAAKYG